MACKIGVLPLTRLAGISNLLFVHFGPCCRHLHATAVPGNSLAGLKETLMLSMLLANLASSVQPTPRCLVLLLFIAGL